MSHIDRALRAWEEARGVVAPQGDADSAAKSPSGPGAARFRLDQYDREDALRVDPSPVPPVSARIRPPVETDETPVRKAPVPAVVRPRAVPQTRLRPEIARPDADVQARLVTGRPGSAPLEQYRRLAAVLHDLQLQQGLKTLMLTSALPAEGKTLTIVNLALTLSESYGRRVLVIDADLRWPSVHTVLGVSNHTGLSEVLLGQDGLELPICHKSPRLAVLPAGRPGPTPLAALTSARMAALIDECASHFDWVLLDTPPVGLMPDAQLLARLTRAVVLVIAAGATPAAAVERAVAELGAECIIGTVLNRVDERRIPDTSYYAHYGAPTD